MPMYTMTYEMVTHYCHEVEADNEASARILFETNQSVCVDTQETWNQTDIEEVE